MGAQPEVFYTSFSPVETVSGALQVGMGTQSRFNTLVWLATTVYCVTADNIQEKGSATEVSEGRHVTLAYPMLSHGLVQHLEHEMSVDSHESWFLSQQPELWHGLHTWHFTPGASHGSSDRPLHTPGDAGCILMTDSRPFSVATGLHGHTYMSNVDIPAALPYWAATVYINLLYAARWGYDLYRVQLPTAGLPRHPSWYKVATLRVLLPKFDWVLYLDSDAFVLDQTVSVERIMADHQLLGQLAWFPTNYPIGPELNAGIMLVKQHPLADMFFTTWWEAPLQNESLSFSLQENYWEQTALNDGGVKAQFADAIVEGDGSLYTSPEGLIIRHVWSTLPEEVRHERVWKALQELYSSADSHPPSVYIHTNISMMFG